MYVCSRERGKKKKKSLPPANFFLWFFDLISEELLFDHFLLYCVSGASPTCLISYYFRSSSHKQHSLTIKAFILNRIYFLVYPVILQINPNQHPNPVSSSTSTSTSTSTTSSSKLCISTKHHDSCLLPPETATFC